MFAFALRAPMISAAFGLVAAAAGPTDPPTRDVARAPLVGKVPPELRAADADWLAGPPTTLAALKGKVVWLQFNF